MNWFAISSCAPGNQNSRPKFIDLKMYHLISAWSHDSRVEKAKSFHSICICLRFLLFNRLRRWGGCPGLYWSRLKNHWSDLWSNLRKIERQKRIKKETLNLHTPPKAAKNDCSEGSKDGQFFVMVPWCQSAKQPRTHTGVRNHSLWHPRLSCIGATLRHLKEHAARNRKACPWHLLTMEHVQDSTVPEILRDVHRWS